jgi:hypothetical protein
LTPRPGKTYNEYKPKSAFVKAHLQAALRDDALLTSHPVEVPVPTRNDIDQIFDGFSYSKAASGGFLVLPSVMLVLMLEKFCECFQAMSKKRTSSVVYLFT